MDQLSLHLADPASEQLQDLIDAVKGEDWIAQHERLDPPDPIADCGSTTMNRLSAPERCPDQAQQRHRVAGLPACSPEVQPCLATTSPRTC